MMFQLTEEEYYILRSQFVTSRLDNLDNFDDSTVNLKCQNGTSRLDNLGNNLKSKNSTSSWGGLRYMPYVFTEQGIYMLMTVLKGELAVKQSLALVRLCNSYI